MKSDLAYALPKGRKEQIPSRTTKDGLADWATGPIRTSSNLVKRQLFTDTDCAKQNSKNEGTVDRVYYNQLFSRKRQRHNAYGVK